ncbi:MAG: hypothetical protein ACKOSS_03220 [Planctomycetia bacterium]
MDPLAPPPAAGSRPPPRAPRDTATGLQRVGLQRVGLRRVGLKRAGLALLLLLGLASVLLLLAPALGLEALLPGVREVALPAAGPELGAEGPARASGPRLSAAPAAAPAAHGPVRVEVVDLVGRPLPGVRVRAVPAPQAAPDGSAAAPWTSDALGLVHIADLPYDGRTQVQALLRPQPSGEVSDESFDVEVGQDSWVVRGTLRADGGNGGSVVFLPSVTVTEGPAPAPEAPPAPGRDEPARDEPARDGEQGAPSVSERSTLEADGEDQRAASQEALRALREALQPSPSVRATAPVLGPTVRLVVDAGLPLEVRVEEAGDGRARPDVRWRVSPRLAWAEDAFGAPTLPVTPGEPAHVGLRVEAPADWVARNEASYSPFIHPGARRLQATYPVRPLADLALVVPEEAQPLRAEDWSGSITVAGQPVAAGSELRVDARGRLRVRGGAFLRGDLVQVQGRLGTRFAARGQAVLGSDARDTVEVPLVLEPLPPVTDSVDVHGLSFAFGGSSIQVSLGGMQAGTARAGESRTRGPLPLRVLDGRGAPAAGARVRVRGASGDGASADASGCVVLPDVEAGPVRLVVLGAGAPCVLEVQAGALPRSEQVLATPVGGTLEVTVEDETGAGLPCATLELALPEGLPWIDLQDGVQRLDPLTDARGRRTLSALPLGKVVLVAHFGTRSAQAEVQVEDGRRQAVTLRLPSRTLAEPGAAPAPAR